MSFVIRKSGQGVGSRRLLELESVWGSIWRGEVGGDGAGGGGEQRGTVGGTRRVRPAFRPWPCHRLCDTGKLLKLLESQFPHLESRADSPYPEDLAHSTCSANGSSLPKTT